MLHQAVEVVRCAQDDNIFLNAGSWLDRKPEFYGAEARDWVEGFVVAFEESDGAARGDCGGMARCREPDFHIFSSVSVILEMWSLWRKIAYLSGGIVS